MQKKTPKKKYYKIIAFENWNELGIAPINFYFKNRAVAKATAETLEELRQQFKKGLKK